MCKHAAGRFHLFPTWVFYIVVSLSLGCESLLNDSSRVTTAPKCRANCTAQSHRTDDIAEEMLRGLPDEKLSQLHLEREKLYLLLASDAQAGCFFRHRAPDGDDDDDDAAGR